MEWEDDDDICKDKSMKMIHDIKFSSNGLNLVVASEDGHVYLFMFSEGSYFK